MDTFDVYLGHLQAPTGSNRKWSEETTHPFHIGAWIIAHNGVITNQDSLIKEYNNSFIRNDINARFNTDKIIKQYYSIIGE